MKYSANPKPVWITELTVTFFLGFTLATGLWLGLWFLQARPAQAVAMDEREAELAACQTAREELQKSHETIAAAKQQLDTELREAKLGWGRCLREKQGSETAARDARASHQP